MTHKPTIAIDFDGVVHGYSKGWMEGRLYDPIVPGFFEWAEEAQKDFKLVIHSSRCGTEYGRDLIRSWIKAQLLGWQGTPIEFDVVEHKPPAWLTLDDRCIRFDGDWSAPELQPQALKNYKAWMNRSEGDNRGG